MGTTTGLYVDFMDRAFEFAYAAARRTSYLEVERWTTGAPDYDANQTIMENIVELPFFF